MNSVIVEKDVEIITSAGTFKTTHISIIDIDDGIVSWEWYNSTVRNYVRIIDRLPGSHSDSVIYDLTSYDIPTTPRFVTEEGKLFNEDEYRIDWAEFEGATEYELVENGNVVYSGTDTNFQLKERGNGGYSYQITVTLSSGEKVSAIFSLSRYSSSSVLRFLSFQKNPNILFRNRSQISISLMDLIESAQR